MHNSLVTVSYRPLKDEETNPSSQIYDLYIQSMMRLLKMFSYFIILYSSAILVFRSIEISTNGFDNNTIVVWGSSVGMHLLAMLTGVFGLRAIKFRSRGTSRNFFYSLVVFIVVYTFVQSYYFLSIIQNQNKDSYIDKIVSPDLIISFSVYFIMITTFALIFIALKAYRFHTLLSKLIEKNSLLTRP